MKFKKVIKIALIICLCLGIIGLSLIFGIIKSAIDEVKDIEISLSNQKTTYCSIYNQKGDILNNSAPQENNYIPISKIRPETIEAFISIEDKQFYKHDGLNYGRILKAMFNNVISGSLKEGASTISQQLIKNKYLSKEKTLKRKIKEAYLSKKLEAKESKDNILESYLNTIYFGNGAYGIGNAALRFFSKTPQELTLSESCILAGLIKSPNTYSPINNIEKCKTRRNLVLKEMYEDNLISYDTYKKTINEEINLSIKKLNNYNNLDLYSKCAINEASLILNISKEEILNKGYKIYTYQDSKIQNILDSIICNEQYYAKNRYGNIADSMSIIIDNKTGGISAVSGKSNYDLTNFKRQPGSLVKPVLVYAPALNEGIIYPCSQILDEKTTINNYSPKNVSDKYYGYVNIYDAVAKSLNIPAIKLCNEIGIETCKSYAKRCGIELDEDDMGLAISLGGLTKGLTLQNITESYIPFSNNGKFFKSKYIDKIISPQNLTVYTNIVTNTNYCNLETSYLMTEILKYSTKNGTSKKLSNLPYDVAGKTGTVNLKHSNLNTDAYSLAYTSDHTMSVWLGNYSMNKEYFLEGDNNGGTYTTEIIKDTFEKIYENNKPSNFNKPSSVISLPVDIDSLNKEHKVKLGYNLPEKYIEYYNFSSYNVPSLISEKNTESPIANLILERLSNSCKLTFDTKEYCDYLIYKKINNNNFLLLKKISNNNGKYNYIDKNIEANNEYKYFVKVKSKINNKEAKSNIVSLTYEKDYDNYLNNYSDNISWLF